MEKMKKFFALLVAMLMVLGMSMTAFAAGTGSITIAPPSNVDKDTAITYKIYKVFDADGNGTAISYKLVEGKTTAPACFTVDSAGNVTYSGSATGNELTPDDIAKIADYVSKDTPVATATSEAGADAVAGNLPNGYYYITTSTGTAVTINSTNPNVKVDDKNIIPSLNKKAKQAEDQSYMELDEKGKNVVAQVGKVIPFEATITVGKGAKGYVYHDKMSDGLAYQNDLKIEVTYPPTQEGGNSETVDITNNTNVNKTPDDGETITVKFADDYLKSIEGATITITYSAKVTSDALQLNPATNTASLGYGEDGGFSTDNETVNVYNAKLNVSKQDGSKEPLAGAGFIISNIEGKYYYLTTSDGSPFVSWISTSDDATVQYSDASGAVPAFTGLPDGTYTLIEKVVPSGYNRAEDINFTIAKSDYTPGNLSQSSTVTNQAGSTLPSTGGIGTTIFYVVGAILVVGAGVVLITRRRMSA